MNKVKTLIEKKELIKKLQEEVKQIEQELLLDWFEQEEVDDYIVKKQTRINFKLKPDIDQEEVVDKYPEAVEIKVNTKALSKIPEAQKLLEVQETEYLTVREKKK